MSAERGALRAMCLTRGRARPSLGFALALALTTTVVACGKPSRAVEEHRTRGDAALTSGRYALALSAYLHARELAPDDGALQRAVMRARVHLFAEDPSRASPSELSDLEYAATLLRDTDAPSAAAYHTALGHVHMRSGRRDQAKTSYEQATALDAASPLAHAALGAYFADLGGKENLARASDAYDTALRARPEFRAALIGFARVKLADDDPGGAADKLESALRLSDDFLARSLLATARMRQERPADAVAHYRRATELEPRNLEALQGLGQALLGAGRAAEAEPVLRTVLEQRPDRGVQSALGFSLNQQRKFAAAWAVFQQVLAADPLDPPALLGGGVASEGIGELGRARELYEKLLAVPVEGPRREIIIASQRDARARKDALSAAAAN